MSNQAERQASERVKTTKLRPLHALSSLSPWQVTKRPENVAPLGTGEAKKARERWHQRKSKSALVKFVLLESLLATKNGDN